MWPPDDRLFPLKLPVTIVQDDSHKRRSDGRSVGFVFLLLFSPLISNQSTRYLFNELMCWLSGSLTCRLPNVLRSPPARRSLVSSITVD